MIHHSPSYAITIRLRYSDVPGQLGRITTAIGDAQGFIGAVDIVSVREGKITRDIVSLSNESQSCQRLGFSNVR